MYHISVTNRLETEEDYQVMVSRKRFNAMKLHVLIRNICKISTSFIVDDVVANMIEALHNFALIRGEECNSLHTHLEASDHRFSLLKQT